MGDFTLDPETGKQQASNAPACMAAAVTKSDTVDIAFPNAPGKPARALWIGGAGDVAVLMADDASPTTFSAVPAGTMLPFRAKRVYATGTTATNIVAVR